MWDMLPQLHPYQLAALAKFASRPDKRLILAHSPGAGKSRVGLEVFKALGAQRMLVVGSVLARSTWVRETEKWRPDLVMHSIKYGRENKSLTKAQFADREAAYAAPLQVVSYKLLKHIDAGPRDLVIFDEAHALRNPTSQQSRIAKVYMRAHPTVPALLFTATPVPNEIVNIWNLVDTLFPNYLGEETDTGDVSWAFKRQYCLTKEGWQGRKVFYGANTANLPRLAAKLEPVMHRVSSAEVNQFAPKLNPRIQWIDDPKLKDADIAGEWLDEQEANETPHVALVCWLHATAHALVAAATDKGWPVTLISGEVPADRRIELLLECATKPRMCLVMTAGSIAESINELGFVKQGMIFEWRATPGQAVQLMKRFARQNSKSLAPVFLAYVARTDDETDAKLLSRRLDAVASLYEQDPEAEQLKELMAPREMTEDRLIQLSAAMFGERRVSLGGFLEDDDDE